MLDLSVVIPLYNEINRLPRCMAELLGYLSTTRLSYELVLVDNGSTDGTGDLVNDYAYNIDHVLGCHLPKPGKGAAVRFGMLQANGAWRMMCDVDLSMSPEQIGRLIARRFDYDVVIASREVKGAVRIGEPVMRKVMSLAFRQLTHTLLPGIRDTQCGFKLFSKRAALEIFPLQTIPGFGFDMEILHIAELLGYRTVETPIVWRFDCDSRVHPIRDSWQMAVDVLTIRRNEQAGLYNIWMGIPLKAPGSD